MESLPLIPTPASQRWRDFRMKGVPAIVFLLTLSSIVFLWNKNLTPSSFMGEVQGPMAEVISPKAGLLVDLQVSQFDRVKKGQVIARVSVASQDSLESSLAVLKTDMEVMRARMAQDQQRNVQNYQQIRLNLLDQRVQLAMSKENLQFAQVEYDRNRDLFEQGVISAAELDAYADRRDTLAAEVRERTELVRDFEKTLDEMNTAVGTDSNSEVNQTIRSAIAAQAERLKQAEGMIVLRAPMDGIVSVIDRRQDENVLDGERVVVIAGDKPDRIIGFVRQPLSFEPRVGDPIQVRTRGTSRQVAMATITKVGTRMELFTQPMRVRGFDSSQERGLPVLIDLPQDLGVHAGELVDLFVVSSR